MDLNCHEKIWTLLSELKICSYPYPLIRRPPPPPPNHAAENQVARQRRCNEASIFFNKHVASLDLYWYNDYVKFLESDRSYEARALINFLSFRMGAYSRGRFIEALW